MSASLEDPNNNMSLFDEIKTLKTQNGGTKCPRIFSDGEYERRLSNLRMHMNKEVRYECTDRKM